MSSPSQSGHFAKKQIFSASRLIRWSHARRFVVGVESSKGFGGKRILDFGCGDGTYFRMLIESGECPSSAIGLEVDPRVIADNDKDFADHPEIGFKLYAEFDFTAAAGTFDAVICMEVLEHIPDPTELLRQMHSLLRPGGRFLISVPNETGLGVLVKQTARAIAGWRGIGDYPGMASYTWMELLRSVFAGETQHVLRTSYWNETGQFTFHCHKGFNWRQLRKLLTRSFTIERLFGSPLSWIPLGWSSQIWIVAQKHAPKLAP
jgi:SAM-dependent methyltransferase